MLTPEQRAAEVEIPMVDHGDHTCADWRVDGPAVEANIAAAIREAVAEAVAAKDKLIAELSERVAAQAEVLARKSERPQLFDRVVEALRPFAPMNLEGMTLVMVGGYSLPSSAIYEARAVLAEVDAEKAR